MPILPAGAAPAAAAPSPPRPRFTAALDARLPRATTPTTGAPGARSGPAAAGLASVERAQARLDEVLAAARSGKTFTSAELLALQAEAYRCAQVVDLGAKLAEQGAQAVRQALNAQV